LDHTKMKVGNGEVMLNKFYAYDHLLTSR